MCVSRIVLTSLSAMPACSRLARSAGSVLDGPGSRIATPPGPCRITEAITPLTS
jgi:hypothetical protein